MALGPSVVTLTPPLQFSWRSPFALTNAIAGDNALYGFNSAGEIVAVNGGSGAQRWVTGHQYVGGRISRTGSRLVAYRKNEGLTLIDDLGVSPNERVIISFGANESTTLSMPVLDEKMIYYAVNQGLYAVHQDMGLRFGTILSDAIPHAVALVSPGEIITVNGYGIPSRYQATGSAFSLRWNGEPHGVTTAQSWKTFIVANNRIIVGIEDHTFAYDLGSGQIAWHLANLPARSFATDGEVVYAAFNGAALWAINALDGTILWQRQYLYDISVQREYGIALVGDSLYFGGALAINPDGALLMAVDTRDGSFSWLSRSANSNWAGGIPTAGDSRIYVFGGSHVGSYVPLQSAPRVGRDLISISPRPVRGAASQFGTGSIRIDLPVTASVSVSAFRERQGASAPFVTNAQWAPGTHEFSWSVSGAGGFSDASQFGYILVDVTEANGPSYTQALLTPVNTFPDIVWHWAKTNIEIMIFNKYVSGYPEQTFRPDALVNRAESSTIVAKTLGLEAPSAGFQTKFTDMNSHWARNFVLALEERGVIGGFLEPDGTYTFRPDLSMTRAQEARILVRAYAIPPAPGNFATKFTDIGNHWAADDIKALESAGYVNGFREVDGTFTYRPEQNLTRAELCTVVVRIRRLTR